MRLESHLFKIIIENTPLISIDLIVRDYNHKVLLGRRQNRPAKNFWFVPGGRVLKDEPLEEAFKRITFEELGRQYYSREANFLGIYEHFYNDNFFNSEFTTHYIVLGYEINLSEVTLDLPTIQHDTYKWFDVDMLLKSAIVHPYTKNYFSPR
ncbi:GDP-mannose mannosyl hydrolase [Citrobacter sedlakii]|uniref:GDP-mannose mannosyl hydrolase n=1 Tax=Citrobacter sedlakii TaxID=67826 RepID=UPI00334449E1